MFLKKYDDEQHTTYIKRIQVITELIVAREKMLKAFAYARAVCCFTVLGSVVYTA